MENQTRPLYRNYSEISRVEDGSISRTRDSHVSDSRGETREQRLSIEIVSKGGGFTGWRKY